MNLQYISDSKGKTTGVFIPINEWNALRKKYKDIEQEEIDVPEWHKELVLQRLEHYKNDPAASFDFDVALDEIEKGL